LIIAARTYRGSDIVSQLHTQGNDGPKQGPVKVVQPSYSAMRPVTLSTAKGLHCAESRCFAAFSMTDPLSLTRHYRWTMSLTGPYGPKAGHGCSSFEEKPGYYAMVQQARARVGTGQVTADEPE
jgi:hypothetical protein